LQVVLVLVRKQVEKKVGKEFNSEWSWRSPMFLPRVFLHPKNRLEYVAGGGSLFAQP